MDTIYPPVLNKRDMYRRIEAGEFGNTLPRWYTLHDWYNDPKGYEDWQHPQWGIQSTSLAGDPRARLNYPRDDVYRYVVESGLDRDGVCISPMVTQYGRALWEGDVYDHPERGLICSGNLGPQPGTWRTHMKSPQLWEFTRARLLLRSVLNENSYDDLMELVARYPNHVYEFTALDVQFGTRPGRNAVMWEVRRY